MPRPRAERDAAGLDAAALAALVAAGEPTVLRGLVRDWPVVAAADGAAALHRYLAAGADDTVVEAFFGEPAIAGRYFYADDLAGFNFERRRMGFREALAAILDPVDDGRTVYLGSVPTAHCLPAFAGENRLDALPAAVGPRLWLGHASNVSCHFDTLDNVACVVAGRRRFTLYPPSAIGDLYVGPLDHPMAGQPVSLAAAAGERVADRFPRFALARERALVAELAPGDALFMPKLWWHQVEGLAAVNGLVNYWWDATGTGPDAPYAAMMLAMITLAERPPAERAAWAAFYRHYVFRDERHPLDHLPPERRGLLGPLRPDNYGRIRAIVMTMLRGGR